MMFKFLEEATKRRESEKQSHIGQDIRDLIASMTETGDRISYQDFAAFTDARNGMNSWEREELVPYFDDDCLIHHIEYCLTQCERKYRSGPCSTYDESVVHLWMPEIIKRLKASAKQGER